MIIKTKVTAAGLHAAVLISAFQACKLPFAHSQGIVSTWPLYLTNSTLDPNATRSATNFAQYYGIASFGSPAQNFTLQIDTATNWLWVPSSQCPTEACITHRQYNANQSSTAVQFVDYEVEALYASSTDFADGYLVQDTFSVGSPPVIIQNQGFGSMTNVSVDQITQSEDGVMGLAPMQSIFDTSNLNVTQFDPFFSMVIEGLLDKPQFSLWLNPNITDVNAGEVVFGGVNAARHTAPLKQLAANSSALYWQTELQGITVAGKPLKGLQANAAFFDSGSAQTAVPVNDFKLINEAVAALGFNLTFDSDNDVYTIPCESAVSDNLPSIGFTMNGTTYSIPPSAWITSLGESSENDTEYGSICESSIVPTSYSIASLDSGHDGASYPIILGQM
ncbi:hypothetical protein WJX73_010425 [Symbiochloris irregularis]|uniref:Peptidase A1 domain-containing protein n=1 Tax=Symbiochloris irregularis TaxID=706552 RepID=A0AAW1NH93_9CHLO